VLAIFGGNASGKSALLSGLLECRQLVRNSFTSVGPSDALDWTPFALDRQPDAPATRFELDMTTEDGHRFHYGFQFRDSGIDEEWLYQWSGPRRRLGFHRALEADGTTAYRFGESLGRRAAIEQATRRNSLYLSCAVQFNHEGLRPVYDAIVSGIQRERRVELRGYPIFQADEPVVAPKSRHLVLEALAAADLGIVNFEVEDVPRDGLPATAEAIFQPEFLKQISSTTRQGPRVRVIMDHSRRDAGSFRLPQELESRGTHVLLSRLSDVFRTLDEGHLLVIDELDTSLHPLLCEKLVALFTSAESNPSGGQLLFATHEVQLQSGLRTDEVVLVDKDPAGESNLRVASDYAGVRTRDDLRAAYLQGRLRGVPIVRELRSHSMSRRGLG
jgi:hypothetical protein